MRISLAILLLSLAFFSQLGYYGIYAVQQTVIRHEQKKKMLAQLKDSELDQIPHHQDMEFMDDGKEFSLHGELYDIVRTKKLNGRIIYLALNDKKETQLLKKMSDAGKTQSQNSAEKKGGLKFPLIFCESTNSGTEAELTNPAIQNPVQPHWTVSDHTRIIVPPPNRIAA